MKPLLLFTLSVVLVVSCQKQIISKHSESHYLNNIKKDLNDSLSNMDFVSLDFSKCIMTNRDSATNYLRIPFKGIKISEQFVLLKTNTNGNVLKGFIINLKKDITEDSKIYSYNGYIKMFYLSRIVKLESKITNGYITSFHHELPKLRSLVVPTPSANLPEVVVTCYINGGGGGYGGWTLQDWIRLYGFWGDEGNDRYGSGGNGWYSSLDGSYPDDNTGNYGTGGGIGYNGTDGGYGEIHFDEKIHIDFELVESLIPIELLKYLKCFSNIPDEGSTCSIEIFSDIPIDKYPSKLIDWQTGSPGHTFIQLKKIRGGQTVMQNIGFYPLHGWKTLLTNAPVAAKFTDNGTHEFNASLKMNVSPEQFRNTLNHMLDLSKYIKYDIDEYNCTDFSLDVFNYTRISNAIEIPKYDIPGGMTANGTSTPQGLYNKLVSMQQAGAESPNITIPGVKGFVAESNGPCN